MVRLKQLFEEKSSQILNIYTTAGYPKLGDTEEVVLRLAGSGADLVELGMPYSDPMADGETIQKSSEVALKNGMTLDLLFEQSRAIREQSNIPMILMGYLNQMLQYGAEKFLKAAADNGIDGMIIPDLPMEIYKDSYKTLFEQYGLGISFLVTPETSNERIRLADDLSSGFLYVVSQSKITGSSTDLSQAQIQYFERLQEMNLKSPWLIGFGIHDANTFNQACEYGQGAIIGSAFIRYLGQHGVASSGDFVAKLVEDEIA